MDRRRPEDAGRHRRRWLVTSVPAGVLAAYVASPGLVAPAQAASTAATGPAFPAPPSLVDPGRPRPLDGASCERIEIDYALGAGSRIRVSDTLLGAGDGEYDLTSGTARLRFMAADGKPVPGAAELLALKVAYDFTAVTQVAGLKTRVRTAAVARNTPDRCGVVARGVFDGSRLTFREDARGYRCEGKLYCEGALCGRFGAPPAGESAVAVGPFDASYRPLALTDGAKALTMEYSQVARTESPRQTTSLRLVAREVKRACVAAPACK